MGVVKGSLLEELGQFDVRQALACRSSGDKLKFVGHFISNRSTALFEVVYYFAVFLCGFAPLREGLV